MEKIPLILFSGGLDSTALVASALQKGQCDVMYADGGQHPEKVKQELRARREIIEYLNATSPHKVRQDYRVPQHISFASAPGNRYSQPAAWLFTALNVIDYDEHSELQVGYVYDDGGFCRWLPNIANAWRELQTFSRWHDPIPVDWPLIDKSKVQILRDIDPELINMIWVCEQPETVEGNVKQCGKCRPCKTARSTLAAYKEEFGYTVHTRLLFTRLRRELAKPDGKAMDTEFAKDTVAYGPGVNRHLHNVSAIRGYVQRAKPTDVN